MSKGIPIIIPSLDPDSRLVEYCRQVRAKSDELIVLVDDGSSAKCQKVFSDCAGAIENIKLLRHDVNRGKGRALKTAFAWLLENCSDIVGCVTVDSDGQHLVDDVLRCVEASLLNPAALVLGCRVFTGEHVPWKSSFGNNWMKLLFKATTGRDFMDTQTGLRVIPRQFMERLLDFKGERFEFETEMLLGMGDVPLVQIPIETVYEEGNKSTHFRPIVDSWKVVKVILKSSAKRAGLYLFSSLSSYVLDISLFYVMYEIVFDSNTQGRLWWAIMIARSISLVYNYFVNEVVVFRFKAFTGGAVGECKRFSKYLVLAIFVMVGSYAIAKTLSILLPMCPIVVSKTVSDLIMFVVAYFAQKFYVFTNGRV